MVKTLRESKAKLSELVECASKGEDVLITVRGQIKAKLTRAEPSPKPVLGEAWADELRAFQTSIGAGRKKPRVTVEQILDEIREERF